MNDAFGSMSTIRNFMAGGNVCNESLYEAFKDADEALQKQIPAEVTEVHVDEYICPACGAENNCDQGIVKDKFCPECGQALYQLN